MTEEKQLDTQPVVSIRATIPVAELGPTVGERIQTLSTFLRDRGVEPAGPPFVRYHTFGAVETDMEFGVPVAGVVAGGGTVDTGELPGGPAVSTFHVGAHNKLGEAYGRIRAWLKEHGREPAGPAWEIYYWIDMSAPDPDDATQSAGRTELVQPITWPTAPGRGRRGE
ncbi:GyrI-like domain-containing protein [Micromonospora sp. CPCC 206061]|uniref:GyrI-like domain-containing protein n=1 Tax=Micromonospora sp. CPCC 206061 TaxID=3122410 RepID=UPI002FF3433B